MDELPSGHRLGAYLIRHVAGRGAVGIVYLAEHEALGRPVAIKTLAPAMAREAVFRERFSREAQGAAAVEHPNIISVFDVGEHEGTPFLVMTYVDGPDLERVLNDRGGKLEPAEAVLICASIADALDAAAAQGLAHRDVKPANILLEGWTTGPGSGSRRRRPHVYLTDFGLIKSSAQARVTQTGQFVGTLLYMAPEQIESRAVPASDQYSLACVLWECLTGTFPFEPTGGSTFSLLTAHISQPVPRISERPGRWSAELDEVFFRALAKDPDHRYPTCTAFIDDATRALGLGVAAPPVAAEPPKTAIEHTQIIPVSPPIPRTGAAATPQPTPPPRPVTPAAPAAPRAPQPSGPDPAASWGGTPAAFPAGLGHGGPAGLGGSAPAAGGGPPRRGKAVGFIVLGVLVVGAVLAILLLGGGDGEQGASADGGTTATDLAAADGGAGADEADGDQAGGDAAGEGAAAGEAAGLVTADAADDEVPDVIAQGRIAFVADGEVWVAHADGSGAADLTGGQFERPLQPAWRPAHDEVAFSTAQGLRVVDVALGAVEVVSEDGEHSDPAWSPSGGQLAFSAPDPGGGRDLVVAGADGSDPRPLGIAAALGGASAFRPAWSPDGERIAFQAEVGGDLSVWIVPADGGEPEPYAGDAAARDFHPAWTPDGDLLFTSDRSGLEQIWLRDADTGEERQVTDADADVLDADPSPCGDWITFRVQGPEADRVAYQALAGGAVTELPPPGGTADASDPSWAGQTCPS